MAARSQCSKCNVPVHWCRTKGRNARGSWVPVEVSPDSDLGHIRKTQTGDRDHGFVTYAESLADDALAVARADREKLYQFHSETCNANRSYNPKPPGLTLDLPNRKANHHGRHRHRKI